MATKAKKKMLTLKRFRMMLINAGAPLNMNFPRLFDVMPTMLDTPKTQAKLLTKVLNIERTLGH